MSKKLVFIARFYVLFLLNAKIVLLMTLLPLFLLLMVARNKMEIYRVNRIVALHPVEEFVVQGGILRPIMVRRIALQLKKNAQEIAPDRRSLRIMVVIKCAGKK